MLAFLGVARAVALAPPLDLWRCTTSTQRAAVSMNLRLSKSSGGFADVEKDLLGKIGLGDAADADEEPEEVAPVSLPPAPAPRSGTQPWGTWSHENDSIELEIQMPDGARARDLDIEVSKDGAMKIAVAGAEPALLSGQLALPVDRTELMWAVEDELLCVELPLRSIMHDGQVGMQGEKAMSCIFSSLAISGASCVEPGLSSGK